MLASLFVTVTALALLSSALPNKPALANVVSSCRNANDVALTFDDGPYEYLYDISNTLSNAGARGTFFFNGNNFECIYSAENQARVKYAYNHGHQIGSHTWAHQDLTTLSWDQIQDEMWRVEQALIRFIGVSPAFMRPPFGKFNDLVRQVSATRNQTLVIWDFDSGDTAGASVAQSKATYDKTIRQHPRTILALNHETYETTAHQVLPYAISKLQEAGYNLVTVAECLGEDPYQSNPNPPGQGPWTC